MSIQQNINQLFAMAGTATMLSPQLRQKAEDRAALAKLSKQEKALSEQEKVSTEQNKKFAQVKANLEKEYGDSENPLAQALIGGATEAYEAGKEELRGITAEQEDVARKLFQLQPSTESMNKLMQAKAMSRMRNNGRIKVEQKSEFDKFRESLDSNDPFHQLSPEAQKIAYEQYKKGGK